MWVSRLCAVAAGLAVLGLSSAAQAQQKFDGRWSVLLETEKGECDRAYRYPIAIENGVVRYAGDAGFNVSGKVASNGSVQGNVAAGQTKASVRGRLAGASGSGTWTISSGSRNCSGNWSAEKRG
jgi:hypothetical protein